MAASDTVDFCLVVEKVDPARIGDAASRLARALSLDTTLAEHVCRSAPVVLLEGLSKSEMKELQPRLAEASKAGAEFRLTVQPKEGTPRISWPERPQLGEPAPSGAAFYWGHSAFVCPCCGETFVFQRS
jgi:hypothetical protein